MRRFSPLALAVVVLILGGAALIKATSRMGSGCPPASPSDGIRLAVERRANNALIADATLELAEAAPVFLEYGNADVGWLRTPTMEIRTSQRLPILRLLPTTTYQVRAFTLNAAGCPSAYADAQFATGRLPAQFQKLAVQASGRPSFPLALMDLHPPESLSRWLTVRDQQGRLVWYYAIPEDYFPPLPAATNPKNLSASPVPIDAASIKRRADGNLVYLAGYYGLEEITLDGQVVHRFHAESGGASRPHHDLAELPDGKLLFLGAEDRAVDDSRNGGPPNLMVRGDSLHLLDLETGLQKQVWSAFDSLDPTERSPNWPDVRVQEVVDWTHGNTVSLGSHGNILLSFRFLDQIISLAPDYKTVEWRLGGPGSSFSFPDPSDRFYGQHAVEELPNGHLLLFDNGNFRPEGDYSRALELELDFTNMTAYKVWEYRHQPDLYANRQSNAIRLGNGDTLVNFGAEDDLETPTVLVEVGPDGSSAWELQLKWTNRYTTRYRAYPMASLAGEVSVDPTPISGRSGI